MSGSYLSTALNTALRPGGNGLLGRVRVECRAGDSVQAEHRVRALLSATGLRAEGLPDSSILCVRRWQGVLPRMGEARQWERDLASDLGRAAQRAARPLGGHVPADAGAIVFRDEAELLACLTLDWVAGTLRAHWWWSALLKGRDPDVFVARTWLDGPQLAPAAFEMLSVRGQAVAFVRQLSESYTRELLVRMLAAHGIKLKQPVEFSGDQDSQPAEAPRVAEATEGQYSRPAAVLKPGLTHALKTPRVEAPWLAQVPEIHDTGLPPEGELLIACALLLRRNPSLMRSSNFQARLERWYAGALSAVAALLIRTTPAPQSIGNESPALPPAAEVSVHPGAAVSPRQGDEPIKEEVLQGEPISRFAPEPQGSLSDALSASNADSRLELPVESIAQAISEPEPLMAPVFEAPWEPSALAPIDAVTQPDETVEWVNSAFAGVFLLVNVALFLEYYPDFTTPADRGLELNIWDFITLMGIEFCPEGFDKDAIWPALARLAGRTEGEAPGHSFEPPNESLADWTRRTASTIRARLNEALERDDAVELLCGLPGRIGLTPVDVHVYFSLDAHPIEIRLAGLDRNPGWIPAAGRYVHFHFD